MPHIHNGDNQHDLTTSAYIVKLDGKKPKILLHMHKKLGRLLPVGGHVELNETPWQAIAHELKEESGYNISQLQILQPKSRLNHITGVVQHPYPISMNTHDFPGIKHFHSDIQYGFVANEDPASPIDDGESPDLRWLTHAELNSLTSNEIYDNTKDIYNFIIQEALDKWDAVPTSNFLLAYPNEFIS